jgi:hypothetical protein
VEQYKITEHTSVLSRVKGSKTKYQCPVCHRSNLDINVRTGAYKCFSGGCAPQEIRAAIDKLEGKPEWKPAPDDWVKPIRPKARTEYFYPDRDGNPLIKVVRSDDGEGNKNFPQFHWTGSNWQKGNPQEIRHRIPIYQCAEVRAAIGRGELIFLVEGEATADLLWKLGIAATTTLGGSDGYSKYGSYQEDLEGGRLVLTPDRDRNGLKYIAHIEADFPNQIEGYYLAGTQGLWRNPQGGMDIGDDLGDLNLTKEQILAKVISPSEYQQIVTSDSVQAQLLDLIKTELLLADGKPRFTTSWDDGLNWETAETTPSGEIKRVRKFIGNHIEAIAYVKNPEGGGTGILLEFRTQRHERLRLLIPRTTLVGDGLDALRAIVDKGYYYNLDCKKQLLGYLFGLGGDVEQVYTIADKTGWVNGSFLTPGMTYGDPNLRFREPEPDNSLTEMKGNLADWKNQVAAKCAGNSRLRLLRLHYYHWHRLRAVVFTWWVPLRSVKRPP